VIVTIPNLITISGMVSYLLFFCLSILNVHMGIALAFSLLVYSYIADNLDGYIARRMNQTSLFGMVADLVTDKCRELLFAVLIIIKIPSITWAMIIFIIWTVTKATIIIPGKIKNKVESDAGRGWKDNYYKPLHKWIMEISYHGRSLWLIAVLLGWHVLFFEYVLILLITCELYAMIGTSIEVLKQDKSIFEGCNTK